MRKDVLIMLAGCAVAFIPFLGFPNTWDTAFYFVLGLSTIGLGISVRRGSRPRLQTSLFDLRKGVDSVEHHEA